ncbi:uncharacterized protein EDB93DRAFT_1101820 [Suillus bovinus]|uniref:uncharacterized protein n=1 Tax=Suillus bovinus TaxID=48563 RepID=UPI001B8710A5|nr:uncharacterized protein EDB93DRAFT_1101820 [Suillus bovinus]KAG2155248.1 hypothetical protein EDB93DRAFT_1101820 [Suillus bovinus]
MTILGNLKTGTYTLRNASTNDFLVVQGPKDAATLVTGNDGRAENAAWVIEKLSGHYDKYNIRSFAHNSYATVNSIQKRSAALTCGRQGLLTQQLIQALLTDDRTNTVHWYLQRVSA